MTESIENIWWHYGEPNTVVCITTNGIVKLNGDCVMGRGNALQATQKIKGIARELGTRIKEQGNVVTYLDEGKVIAFPVKKAWYLKADLALIAESARLLRAIAIDAAKTIFYLPRPGCGNGQLEWEQVRPLLEELPGNVRVCRI